MFGETDVVVIPDEVMVCYSTSRQSIGFGNVAQSAGAAMVVCRGITSVP